jgi:hypothetical protein
MPITFDNTNIRRKNPIKRNNKFFSSEDFTLEMEFTTEYMEQDANQTIILYQVDYEKTKVNDVYKEAEKGKIRFKTPVELTVIYDLEDAETKAYKENMSKGIYVKPGKLTFSVLLTELEEVGCDISRGDYIGIQITPEYMIYFTVADDGKMGMTSNKNTLYGTQPFYRTVRCNYVDVSEFNG